MFPFQEPFSPIRITNKSKLYTLYLDDLNFDSVAQRLYILPSSSNRLVQLTLAQQLQHAAKEELQKYAPVIDGDEIILEAKLAFEALSNLLGGDDYFFGTKGPGLFDASVFAYTHLLLDKKLGWKNEQLAHQLKKSKNLVDHRERILQRFFRNE
jgi:metaxin